jgi:23S rRNA pseudouridine1911/1915/1917 synthase
VLRLGAEVRGRRLDRALADLLPAHSRTAVAAWIEQGLVRVDGRPRPAKTRVEGGEEVVVDVPPPRPLTVEPEEIPLAILFEDAHLLVVDKPAGLTVHPGSGRRAGTLANALAHHVANLPEAIGSDRPGIVHRLDKDTSGVLVVAKTEPVQRALSAAFARRAVSKVYVACVHGIPAESSGTIDAPIGRSTANRKKMAIRTGGRPSRTRWKIERRLPRHALLVVEPVTGRTHQIRVHLRSIRHPIVGDVLYGNRGAPGEELVPRLLLHARRLSFLHPATGAPVSFEAPLPADFEQALEALATLAPPRRGP